MEQKKETKGQLQRRIEKAVVFIPKDKDTISVYFNDKGLRLTVTEDKAVISTGSHQHVFDSVTTSGVSRPYLYTKRIIEIANENNCEDRDERGNAYYSYSKLLDTLNKKENKSEYNIVTYYQWWVMNIFSPLYSIGETEVEMFMTYLDYCTNIAKNTILLSEKTEDMTNKQFIEKFVESLKEFTGGIPETILFRKKTDEEIMRENIEAMQEAELEETV